MKILMTGLLLTLTSHALAGRTAKLIIYGNDDRQDMRDVQNAALREVAHSTAAMIPAAKLAPFTDQIASDENVKKFSLQEEVGVCSSERFSQQPAIGDCSGFLVGEKTLVTAGHCVSEARGCEDNVWVFGYELDTPGVDVPVVSSNNIYKCAKVIKSVENFFSRMDYAVIELDRPVEGRRALSFRKEGKITENEPLVVIGHPSGLPTKVAGGARVMSVSDVYFQSNLDTYGGNSGSAVFNANTLEVEGILVRGATDYIGTDAGCDISNVVPFDRPTESVTIITHVKVLFGASADEPDFEPEATQETDIETEILVPEFTVEDIDIDLDYEMEIEIILPEFIVEEEVVSQTPAAETKPEPEAKPEEE